MPHPEQSLASPPSEPASGFDGAGIRSMRRAGATRALTARPRSKFSPSSTDEEPEKLRRREPPDSTEAQFPDHQAPP